VSRHWLWIQLFGLSGSLVAFLGVLFVLPESPKFFYIKKRYEESRRVLQYVARFNKAQLFLNDDFWFDTEYQMKTKRQNQEENKPLIER